MTVTIKCKQYARKKDKQIYVVTYSHSESATLASKCFESLESAKKYCEKTLKHFCCCISQIKLIYDEEIK